ncbi:MAG: cation-transporting P-type ATPase, partial [Candidatus Bathyarchaeota archaeon]|nr:cation-transporting P-type ATPase [Candidatus Bathyarchaeota archaeon]
MAYVEASGLPIDESEERLQTNLEAGLTKEDAEERLVRFGANVIPKVKPSLFRIYIAPLLNWLINIYLIISTVLALLAFILPEVWPQIAQWLSIVSINAALAIVQQARAQTKIEALQRLSAPKSRVIRDGALTEIPSELVVPGDIIQLRQGDRIPADARIIAARSLRVDEASLTGESRGVEKSEVLADADSDASISGRRNMVFMGTYVTVGSAKALVVRTGRATELGSISGRLEELNVGEIPLRQKVNEIAKYLGLAVLVFLSILLTYNMVLLYLNNDLFVSGLLNTTLVARAIVRSLITAMSVMPINIPLLTTVTLLTGVLAMAKYRVVIRNPNVVESLGRVSVICSDKTGTITKNEMTVKWVCLPTRSTETLYGVTGVGFQPEGKIMSVNPDKSLREIMGETPETLDGNEAEVTPETPLEYLLVSGMLNNDSQIVATAEVAFKGQTIYKAIGNTTDASILALFSKSKLNEGEYRARFKEALNYPFESRLKRMTRIFKDNAKNQYIVFTKGATEILLPLCSSTVAESVTDEIPLDKKHRSVITGDVDLFASSAYRVISFAFKNLQRLPSDSTMSREIFENELTYLGFVAITDPPREGVRQSVSEAKRAGIRPVMITGDSVETAKSIAHQVGITEEKDLVVEGQQVESLSEEEFSKTSVFARVSPEHKMTIVERYKRQDRVVAM